MMEQLLGGDDRSLDAGIKKIRDESGSRINPLRSRPLFPRPNPARFPAFDQFLSQLEMISTRELIYKIYFLFQYFTKKGNHIIIPNIEACIRAIF